MRRFAILMIIALVGVLSVNGAALAASCSVPSNAASWKAEVGALVNAHRAAKGRSALNQDDKLAAAAQAHACDMAARRTMTHTGADGSAVQHRVERQGYRWRMVAENVAYGTSLGPAGVVANWMDSSPHRRNILDRKARDFGVGVARSGNVNYWVIVFAKPR